MISALKDSSDFTIIYTLHSINIIESELFMQVYYTIYSGILEFVLYFLIVLQDIYSRLAITFVYDKMFYA